MADKKISALTAATTPLAGTEVLPIVQSGTTTKVSVANLTAGRSISSAGASLDGAVTINDSGANVDFRVESDTKTNALLVRGADGFVGLDNSNPVAPLTLLTMAGGDPTYRGEFVINSTGGASGVNSNGGVELKQDPSGNGYGARFFQYFDGVAGYNTAIQYRTNSATWSTPFIISRTGNITLAGNVTLSTDNLIQGTAAKGINFTANTPAAGMTSQLLNWYETGTFSPTVLGSTGGTATYSEQTGYYTRMGNLVFIKIRVTCATVSSMTGQARIGALPFTCSGSSGRNSVQTGTPVGLTGSTTITSVSGTFVVGNTTQIALADASGIIIDASNYTNTFSIDITGVYQV